MMRSPMSSRSTATGDSPTSWRRRRDRGNAVHDDLDVPVTLVENETYYWRARAFDGQLSGGWAHGCSW